MTTITTRAAKGTPLTNDEIDANFTGLNTDKLEKAGGTVSGALTVNGAFSAAAGISSTAVSLTGGVTAAGASTFNSSLAVNNGAFSVSYSTNAFVAATVTNTNAGAAASAVSRLLSNSGSLWLTSKSTAGGGGAEVYCDSSAGALTVKTTTAIPLVFGTGNAEAMRVAPGGYTCINRTSSSFAAGAGRSALAFDGGSEWGMGIKNTNAGAATSYPFAFLNASEGIAGSISITATTTGFNTSSDVRLKENIEDAADSGPVIDAVQVRQFDWKETGEHQDFGVIAQELELVFPSAVTVPQLGPDGEEMHRGVDYSKLVPLLIKEVQSLRARVAQLEGGAQ